MPVLGSTLDAWLLKALSFVRALDSLICTVRPRCSAYSGQGHEPVSAFQVSMPSNERTDESTSHSKLELSSLSKAAEAAEAAPRPTLDQNQQVSLA